MFREKVLFGAALLAGCLTLTVSAAPALEIGDPMPKSDARMKNIDGRELGRAPLEVAFADLSSGHPTSWLWDFGDGTSSSERHPIHVYAAGGSYDVGLVASDALGSDAETRTAAVEVLPPLPSATPSGGHAKKKRSAERVSSSRR